MVKHSMFSLSILSIIRDTNHKPKINAAWTGHEPSSGASKDLNHKPEKNLSQNSLNEGDRQCIFV